MLSLLVMNPEDINTVQKRVYFKSYKNLKQIEKALKSVTELNDSKIQLSVLGKFPKIYADDTKQREAIIKNMEIYWNELLGVPAQFGTFDNPEIGAVFVVGPLTTIFLNKINGKNLGDMTTGIYGILRGLGADTYQAKNYVMNLNNEEYLMIMRGYDSNWDGLDSALKKMIEHES